MVVTNNGMLMLVRLLQFWKAYSPMEETKPGRLMLESWLQPEKTPLLIVVMGQGQWAV